MMRIALNWLTVEVIITIIISTGHIMAVNSRLKPPINNKMQGGVSKHALKLRTLADC